MNHSLTVGRHRARRARVTRDHRIKSPLVSLLFTMFNNNLQHSTTRTQWTYEQPRSPRSVVSYCREWAFVEFKCTRSAPWRMPGARPQHHQSRCCFKNI